MLLLDLFMQKVLIKEESSASEILGYVELTGPPTVGTLRKEKVVH